MSTTVQSVERAFALLDSLSREPAGITELSRSSGLPTSTVARLLGTLEDLGAVERIDDDRSYAIGPAVVAMAAGSDASLNLGSLMHPHLQALADEVGEAAGLSIPAGDEVHYLDQVDSPNPVQVRDWTDERVAMHAVSAGLVLLAYSEPRVIDDYLSRPCERFTEDTVVDTEQIRARLSAVRRDGYVWTSDELEDGITSLAVPLFNGAGTAVAAIHLHGPTYRFPPDGGRQQITDLLVAAVESASAQLGWQS